GSLCCLRLARSSVVMHSMWLVDLVCACSRRQATTCLYRIPLAALIPALSLHDALPISPSGRDRRAAALSGGGGPLGLGGSRGSPQRRRPAAVHRGRGRGSAAAMGSAY